MAYKYNPVTGNWDKVPDTQQVTPQSPPSSDPAPVLSAVPTKDSSVDTQSSSTKEYIQVDYNMLQGDMAVLPNLKYRANKTINAQGIGKYLSGLYYVNSVTIEVNESGVKQTLSLSKNGFGDTPKTRQYTSQIVLIDENNNKIKSLNADGKVVTQSAGKTITSTVLVGNTASTNGANVTPTPANRTYTLVKGDTLSKVASKYYKDSTKWRKIANANNISDAEVGRLNIGRVLIIPY